MVIVDADQFLYHLSWDIPVCLATKTCLSARYLRVSHSLEKVPCSICYIFKLSRLLLPLLVYAWGMLIPHICVVVLLDSNMLSSGLLFLVVRWRWRI